jgi:transcriptional regulator with XRE-family HTH domain
MSNLTIGQALKALRAERQVKQADVYTAANISSHAYIKVERDERDLSFSAGLRICAFYDLSADEFTAMLSPQEINRRDLTSIKALEKQARNKNANEQISAEQ